MNKPISNSLDLSRKNPPYKSINLLKHKVLVHPALESATSQYKINPLAKEYSQWLSKHHSEKCLALTLTFKNKIRTDASASAYLKSLNNALRKLVYPKKALSTEKFNAGKRVSLFAVLENHEIEGIHIHAILFEPPYAAKEIGFETEIIRVWEKITKSSNNWKSILETKQDMQKYLEYSMKLQKSNRDRVRIFCWDSREG